ncbi:MAG: hypothetical protein IJH47_10680 [Oscillospiraceae bacterium]|nr:hypothetical protein [Oscillospiraceae bacterium]
MTDEELQAEIEMLSSSPYVQLARKDQRNKNLKRQRLYTLRWLEKRGRALADAGITMEILRAEAAALRDDMKCDDPDDDAIW